MTIVNQNAFESLVARLVRQHDRTTKKRTGCNKFLPLTAAAPQDANRTLSRQEVRHLERRLAKQMDRSGSN